MWFWGRFVGVAGLIASGAIDPATLGLSEKQKHVLMGVCAAIGIISAQFASSNLPSKTDAEKVTTSSGRLPVVLLACVLGGAAFTLPACASAPPSYSDAGRKAFNADELMKDITALSQVAKNLNATSGKLHLKDSDTALVRDFALSAGAGLLAYGQGQGTLAVVVTAYQQLAAHLSTEAKVNPSFKAALALVDAAIRTIPIQ